MSIFSRYGGEVFGKISGTSMLYLFTGLLLLAAIPKQLQLQSIAAKIAVLHPGQ